MALSVDNLLNKLSALDDATLAMLSQAQRANDLRTALIAVRESRSNVETFAQIAEKTHMVQQLADIQSELEEVRSALDSRKEEG